MSKKSVLATLVSLLLLPACGIDTATPDGVPQAPSGVVATPGPGYVIIDWQDNSNDETGFVVYRDAAGSSTLRIQALEPIAEVPADTEEFVDRTVEPGVAYLYSVAAVGSGGGSAAVQAASSATVGPGIDLAVGSYNFPAIYSEPQTALGFYFFVPDDALPSDSITLSVTGPAGWNGGEAFEVTFPVEGAARGFAWTRAYVPAMEGEYTVTTQLDGEVYSASASTDAIGGLDAAGNVTLLGSGSDSVALSWDAVAGAESYGVIIYGAPLSGSPVPYGGGSTTTTSLVLDGLGLPAGDYAAIVFAYPFDRTAEPPLKPAEFDVSLSASETFTIGAPQGAGSAVVFGAPLRVIR